MRYEDKTFADETVQVDGHVYVRCRFERCTLEYSGGVPPGMESCSFAPLRLHLAGPASNTVNFLRLLYGGGFAMFVEEVFDQIRGRTPAGGTDAIQ